MEKLDWKKKDYKEDSRALIEDDLKSFMGKNDSKKLECYVELAKKRDELQLCFRGNSDSNPRITIYRNNHAVFTVSRTGKLTISFNHARYCKNWKEYYNTLISEYGFSEKKNIREKGEIDVGYMSRPFRGNPKLEYSDLEKMYDKVMNPIFTEYFEASESTVKVLDWFKDEKKGKLVEAQGKKEKIEQQDLYRRFTRIKGGYFFYDLEYAQRHKDKNDLAADTVKKINNHPDMCALYFNKEGKPDKLVFVEVKCTKAAMDGGSGIKQHINKMKKFIKPEPEEKVRKELSNRRKEAFQLMNQYAKLGLRGLDDNSFFRVDDFEKLNPEVLLIFTDEAKKIWESNDYNVLRSRETVKIDIADLYDNEVAYILSDTTK